MSIQKNPFDSGVTSLQALQFLYDVARLASVPAATHDQSQKHAQFLAFELNPPPVAAAFEVPDAAVRIAEAKAQIAAEAGVSI